jgi:hypothetical protein
MTGKLTENAPELLKFPEPTVVHEESGKARSVVERMM